MGIKVVVDADAVRGSDLKSGRKFGTTTLREIHLSHIDPSCTPIVKRGTDCRCQLTGVDIIVTCEVRLYPRLIARGFFDPNPENPRGYVGKRESGRYVPQEPDHIPLDEQSVLLHERSHCCDITDAVGKAIKEALDQNEQALFAFCPCDRKSLCDKTLRGMVRQRIRAIGQDAYEELLRDAKRHKSSSDTEKRARQVQINDFEERDEEADAANDEDDGN